MPQVDTTRLDFAHAYDLGENGWNTGYDANWEKLDGLVPGDFGISSVAGLVIVLLGGVLENESVPGSYSSVAGATITAVDNAVTFVQRNATGAVSTSTGSFTTSYPLWAVTATGGVVTALVDYRYQHRRPRREVSGVATLTAGTVTVLLSAVTAASRVFLTAQSPGGAPGALHVSARSVGVSFTITSTSGTDASVVAWLLREP